MPIVYTHGDIFGCVVHVGMYAVNTIYNSACTLHGSQICSCDTCVPGYFDATPKHRFTSMGTQCLNDNYQVLVASLAWIHQHVESFTFMEHCYPRKTPDNFE